VVKNPRSGGLSRGGKSALKREKATQGAWPTFLIYNSVIELRSGFHDFLITAPISQVDVLFYFSALVSMFVRFVGPISGLAKRILSCPDQVADYIQ
jgi:hypothetical protein